PMGQNDFSFSSSASTDIPRMRANSGASFSHSGVITSPGCTELQRIFSLCSAQYCATDLVKCRTTALLAPYAVATGVATRPATDEMLMIEPDPLRRMALMPARQPR